MKFDVWFEQQSFILQLILLLIPVIGWIIELLVRLSALVRLQSKMNIAGLIVFTIFGGFWVLCLLDVFCLGTIGRLFLYE